MDTYFNELIIPTAAARSVGQTKISGRIPLTRSVSKVYSTCGKAVITNTEVTDGKVLAEGKIILDIICKDTDDKYFSFSSSAAFSHTIDCEGAKPSMTAMVTAQLISIKTTLDGDNIDLDAVLDIMCRVEDNGKKTMLSRKDNSTTEVKTMNVLYKQREKVGSSTVRLREDIVANDIKEVIYTGADALIRDISSTLDNSRVDGILSLNALCVKKDGKLFKFQQNIPFTADVPIEGEKALSFSGKADVSDIKLRMTADEYGLASLEAVLDVSVYSIAESELSLTTDAFSPQTAFDCIKRDMQLLLFKESVEQKTICHETIKMPDSTEKFKEAVFADVRPFVSSATKGENCIIVDGIAFATLLYNDMQGELRSVTDELPFSLSIPTVYDNIELDAKAVCTSANITGLTDEGVGISMTIYITADIFELCDTQIVESVKSAEPVQTKKGFVICFASEGETCYDIAKRFNVSQSSLKEENKELQSVLRSGDKAVLFI